MWLGAFIWVLAHKEKDADITSKTKSQPKQKGFRGFLLISHISTKLKKNLYGLQFTVYSLLSRVKGLESRVEGLGIIRLFPRL